MKQSRTAPIGVLGLALIGLVFAALPLFAGPAPAATRSYPWCAIYSEGIEGMNCGFTSKAQCEASTSGVGGFCAPNTFDSWAPAVPALKPKRARTQR